ncbi:NADH-quinone oxidoreductase subunit L [bacterium BMS3Bbin11]|nr:NADH-quinone oxidoreductase subunit L [bacterium BMS3Abin11]GBE46263.1 NADH-quinone oxidoreductase subunit L [bacterium BMS3Bbin11]GMT40329.1 MAG: NADH dehydrogenase subunit L [bacterium]
MDNMKLLYLAIPLVCLFAALIAGVFGRQIGRVGAHSITIAAVATAFVLSLYVSFDVLAGNTFNGTIYVWGVSDNFPFEIGFLIDSLTVTMMVIVTFISLMVHIYTIGYMRDDPGYQRFFSYISLFTFAMLMLVMSNNFLQLFFGWELVGLVSYLLIGFWYTRESAIYANMKAFLVNRVGDLGFLIGIAAIYATFGTLDYNAVFASVPDVLGQTIEILPGSEWSIITFISILLFIGAMGKSAQVPLHVWLPDSMEGPTPISALIHAATMVTAGIFMVARTSPIFEFSDTALSVVMIIGAITAFFMALLGLVQNDIKRVIAYSTLSQLGYMTVGLGASGYAASIFHLGNHAFFKALLFLAAGSVIIAMHHEQDMRKMGGLRKFLPWTYITALIGSLALAGIPPFAGFFSKDLIIESVHHSELFGSGIAYVSVLSSVVLTAFYSFRLMFMTFHGRPRMDNHTLQHLKESPMVVVLPLLLLAIPSMIAGALFINPMAFGDYFSGAIFVLPQHDVIGAIAEDYAGESSLAVVFSFMFHGILQPPFWLAISGIFLAWLFYVRLPELPGKVVASVKPLYSLLMNKYYFDDFNQKYLANGTLGMGRLLSKFGDRIFIDGWLVNGTAKVVGFLSKKLRPLQSGLVNHYAFAMILGLLVLMTWFIRIN